MVRDIETTWEPIRATQEPWISGAAAKRRLLMEDIFQDSADSLELICSENGELLLGDDF